MKKTSYLNQCQRGKPLCELTTFGIGGPAKWFLQVDTIEDLALVIQECKATSIPYFILGKGSNVLFDDRGFDGLVILNKICWIKHEDALVHAGAGYSFSLLGSQTARKGWSGLEFASGIPASVGGAVYMNAGANGVEVSNVLLDVTYVTEEGQIERFSRESLYFSYRTSSFQTMKGAIAAATFQLKPSVSARKEQLAIIDYRTRTQPYGELSAGCVFRNPVEKSAGALIEQCGLKGIRVGGAEVSTLHSNFIVNKGGATAQHVLELAAFVQQRVKEVTGIDLEMEVRYVPG